MSGLTGNYKVHGLVDDDTGKAWEAWTAQHGPSKASILEALGRRMRAHLDGATDPLLDDLIVAAFKIGAARRRRGGRHE